MSTTAVPVWELPGRFAVGVAELYQGTATMLRCDGPGS
jgi:hypothetical protein